MPRVIVAGAGIAGLASAIALEQGGWSVSVHERAAEIRPLGAALSLWPNATSALDRLGLLDRVAAVGSPLNAMFVADQAGKPIMAARRMTEPALMVTRAALQDCLAGAVRQSPILLDDAISSTEQTASHVEVRFADGRTEHADLLIDAGGIRSPIARAAIGQDGTYCGYGGVIALSDSVPGDLDGMAYEYWGRHQRFGLFEIADRRRYWFFMNTQDAGARSPTHAEVSHHAKHWPSGIAEAVEATPAERLIPFSIFAKPPPKNLGFGRVICVGDAAHAMEPNLGQGACQALEDAAALSVVAKNVAPEAMLAAFETLRLKRVRTIVTRAAEARSGAHGSPFMQSAMRMMLRTLPAKLVDGVSRDVQTMAVVLCALLFPRRFRTFRSCWVRALLAFRNTRSALCSVCTVVDDGARNRSGACVCRVAGWAFAPSEHPTAIPVDVLRLLICRSTSDACGCQPGAS